MDETSTNVWEFQGRIWQPRHGTIPMAYTLPKVRGSNVTIIGAITSLSEKIFYHIGETTNKDEVNAFFDKMDSQIGLKDKVIVMDNHPAHHSHLIREYLEAIEAKILFLPPSSSYFNPIETIWSWLK